MNTNKKLLLFIFLTTTFINCFFICIKKSRAFFDPNIKWQTIETKHFKIIFNAKHYDYANSYANLAEKVYNITTPFFDSFPKKTTILINDSSDIANGQATRIPYPFIKVYPTFPLPQESIGYYGNWDKELLIHEYTHILSFDPVSGFFKLLRNIFGNIIVPTGVLPKWFLEGIAVLQETSLSSHGRIRSPYYNALIRSFTEEKKIFSFDIAEINEVSIPTWPQGKRPYLFGAYLWKELVDNFPTPNPIEKLHKRYGGRIPFFIEAPIKDNLNLTYQELFNQSLKELSIKSIKQIEKIKKFYHAQPSYFLIEGIENTSPSVSPDGKILCYINKDLTSSLAIKTIKREDSTIPFSKIMENKNLIEEENIEDNIIDNNIRHNNSVDSPDVISGELLNKVSWFPDSSKIVFDQINIYNRYFTYSDLFTYDFKSKEKKQISFGLRAKDPSVSPNGKDIVFIKMDIAKNHLALITSEGKNFKIIYEGQYNERLSSPIFLNKEEIMFIKRNINGKDLLNITNITDITDITDIKSKKIRNVLPQYNSFLFPKITTQGIIFTSYQNGIYNIYLTDETFKQVNHITNETTGALYGEIDPLNNHLYYTRFTAEGLKLASIPYENWKNKIKTLPEITPLINFNQNNQQKNTDKIAQSQILKKQISKNNEIIQLKEKNIKVYEAKSYKSYPYLLPHYWFPYVYNVENGWMIAALTGSNDPLSKHNYNLLLGYDTGIQKVNSSFNYINTTQKIIYTFNLSDQYKDLIGSSDELHETNLNFHGNFFLPNLSNQHRAGIGWAYEYLNIKKNDFNKSGISAKYKYSNIKKRGTQISPEKGNNTLINMTHFFEETSDLSYTRLIFNYNQYFSNLLPSRHAFKITLNGLLMPNDIPLLLGYQTKGFPIDMNNNFFLMRGYPAGEFMGTSMLNMNLEYHFPIKYIYQGKNTLPFFLKRIHSSIIFDTITLNGSFYNSKNKIFSLTKNELFHSAGIEFYFDCTLFYNLPASILIGIYKGFSSEAYGEETVSIGLISETLNNF